MRALIEELVAAWQAGDALRASAFFAPDGRYHEAGREPIVGREAIREHFQRFFRDGPPWRFDLETSVVEGERAAIAYRFALRAQDGQWRTSAGCALAHREGGLLIEWREYQG
ncbi:MAG: nuclear transport factor 2 family protein [bacterium]|nr:nuclear transport factor 2 family protein [bacterium]